MSFKKTTLKNVFQLGRFTYSGEVLNFLASIIMARLLLPEEYGTVAMIYVITNFAGILTGLGISSEVIRNPFQYTFHKAMLNLSIYIGFALFLLVILLAYPLAVFYENNDLILPTLLIAFKFPFRSTSAVFYAIIIKEQRYSLLGKIELITNIMTNILMIAMAAVGFSYWSLIIPFLLGEVYKLIRYKSHTNIKIKFYQFKYTRVAFKYSKSLMGSILGVRMISYWARNLDNLLIGKNFGEASLGLYNRGYRFLNLAEKTIDNLFGAVLYPNLQKLKNDGGKVNQEYLFFVGLITLVSFPIGAVLILFPELLVKILWGSNWLGTVKYLPFFGIIVLSRTNKTNIEAIFKIHYQERLLFKFGVFNSAITVLSIVLGSLYSPLMIVKMIAFSQTALILPVVVFYVFAYAMKFKFKEIMVFYVPRLILLLGCLITLLLDYYWLSFAQIILYLFFLLFNIRNDLKKLLNLFALKFSATKQ